MRKKIVNVLLLLFLSIGLFAQSNEYKDIVKLKEGHTVRGKIIEWQHDKFIVIQLKSGAEVRFPFEAIESITQKDLAVKEKKVKEYAFAETGLYNSTSFDASVNNRTGFGITHTIGWQVNRFFGAGLGSGYDSYTFGDERKIIPLFVELRSFILKKNISPYVSLKAGYGFALTNENTEMTDARGGYFLNPEIGYRMGASDGPNFVVGLGLKIQRAEYEFFYPWAEQTNIDKMQFERLVIKFGIIF